MMRVKQPMGLTRQFALGAVLAAFSVSPFAIAQDVVQPIGDEPLAIPESNPLNLDESKLPDGPTQEALKEMVESEGGAVFRGLDKITARVTTVYAPIDEMVTFGSLQFITRQCNKRPPEETPEKTAFLEVKDIKPDQSEEDIFKGWMFASSPALNALEHPVYDIWLIDCIMIEPEQPEGSDENSAG